MITIGIRVNPQTVFFAIYDASRSEILNVEEIKIPKALYAPMKLKYIRHNLLDVLREYCVERAGIRVTESAAKSTSIERIQIEGVIQECFASSSLGAYYIGQISSISKRINKDRTRFKPMIDGENDMNVEDWENMNKERREAVLCAIGAVNA